MKFLKDKSVSNVSLYLNILLLGAILAVDSVALAQAGGGTSKMDFIGKLTGDPGAPIITAILAIFTLITVLEKWSDIMSGQNLAKNLFVIAGWIAMTTWWSALLKVFLT